jgi:dynein heavy chain
MSSFAEGVSSSVDAVTNMTLRVYDNVINGPLKPIPRKSHYTFNLRDISKIFQGVCTASPAHMKTKVEMARLWIHENSRVFGDRLIEDEDRDWLANLLNGEAVETLSLKKKDIYVSERIVFGDFMSGLEVEPRIYTQIMDMKVFLNKIIEYLEEYNNITKTKMKLVMFLDACSHVARIARCIRNPLGNAFLLGVGGSGRQSLSRLATYLNNYKVSQIEIVKGYGMANWRDDVRQSLLQCGCQNKPTTFLFVDT